MLERTSVRDRVRNAVEAAVVSDEVLPLAWNLKRTAAMGIKGKTRLTERFFQVNLRVDNVVDGIFDFERAKSSLATAGIDTLVDYFGSQGLKT